MATRTTPPQHVGCSLQAGFRLRAGRRVTPLLQKILAAAAISAASLAIGFGFGAHYESLQWSLKWEERNAKDNEAVLAAEANERKREQDWQTKLEEVSKNASKQIEAVRKSERSAADNRVRDAAKAYAARERENSCAENGGAPSGVEVLAQLFADADELAERMALEADESRIRGLACEAAYDALR